VQIHCSKQQEGIRTATASYSRTAVVVAFFLQQSHTSISAGYTSLLCSVFVYHTVAKLQQTVEVPCML
jgi:hypothetical protein